MTQKDQIRITDRKDVLMEILDKVGDAMTKAFCKIMEKEEALKLIEKEERRRPKET